MNRKLTATQIIHGARAYSHNASRRAHQLSGPRRERVVCRPRGEPAVNNLADACEAWEEACKCGFVLCSKSGPCAPYVGFNPGLGSYSATIHGHMEAGRMVIDRIERTPEAPKPSPAPHWKVGDKVRGTKRGLRGEIVAVGRISESLLEVLWETGHTTAVNRGAVEPAPEPSPAPVVERQAHRFVVGQRVRYIAGIACDHVPTGVVTRLWSDREVWWKDDNGTERSTLVKHLEPSEPLTSERGAQESDEALLLRCGWTRLPDSDGSGACEYAFGKTPYGSHDRVVTASWPNREMFGAHTNGSDMVEGGLRTLLQAACAALGITLERSPGAPSLWDARLGDALIVHSADDPESCARAAVEAWSAMQREGSDGK